MKKTDLHQVDHTKNKLFTFEQKNSGRVARRGGHAGGWQPVAVGSSVVKEQFAVVRGCSVKQGRQTGVAGEAGREEVALQGDEPFRHSLLTKKPETAGKNCGTVDYVYVRRLFP